MDTVFSKEPGRRTTRRYSKTQSASKNMTGGSHFRSRSKPGRPPASMAAAAAAGAMNPAARENWAHTLDAAPKNHRPEKGFEQARSKTASSEKPWKK